MRVCDHVRLSIDQYEAGEFEASLVHACIAVDGTARKQGARGRRAFLAVLRDSTPILGAIALPGIDVAGTRFSNLQLERTRAPDFAEVIYEAFRCALAHGEQLGAGFRFHASVGTGVGRLTLAEGVLHLPDYLPFGLLGVVVANPVNRDERVPSTYFLSLADEHLPINEWWGRHVELTVLAERHNPVKVTLAGLDRWG